MLMWFRGSWCRRCSLYASITSADDALQSISRLLRQQNQEVLNLRAELAQVKEEAASLAAQLKQPPPP